MISVVVPTLNEAANIARLLDEVARETTPHEVIVADGGSADATVRIARERGASVIACTRGRGAQIAAGAAAARGTTILMLHADSSFPAGGLAAIADALARDPQAVGGNFRLIFAGSGAFARRLTRFYAWMRRRGLYYGDSGVFVRSAVYARLGGVRPIALMEDFDFTRRLECSGRTLTIADPPLLTSSRKFEGRSAAAIVLGWLEIHALYYLGVPPERLARRYYGWASFRRQS